MSKAANKPMVVLVDDDEDDALIIRKQIAAIGNRPFEFTWVSSYEAGQQAISDGLGDLYLIDYRLGKDSGLDLLAAYDLGMRPEPFIILTGAGDDEVERKALKIGVADYLVKGNFGIELLARVLHYSLQRKRVEAQRIQHFVELNRSKDEFIALASHQLRTPATAVKQYVGMLIHGFAGSMTDEQTALLERAYSSNERQLKIVEEILRVAQLDLNQLRINKTELAVSKMLDNVISEITPITTERKQRLLYEPASTDATIFADEAYLTMAITNIVDNASKYSLEGTEITLNVTTSSDTNTVAIAVTDQGVGISAADIKKLFRKFSRIDNILSVSVGGSGLGLYWSKQVVGLHNGTISVVSKIDVGTTFTIELPIVLKSSTT